MEWRGYHLFWAPGLCIVESAHSQLLSAQQAGQTSSKCGLFGWEQGAAVPYSVYTQGAVRFLLSSVMMGKSGWIGALKIIVALNMSWKLWKIKLET